MSPGDETGTPGTAFKVAAALVLCLAVLAAFSPTLDASFVNWDDEANLVDNDEFRGLSGAHLGWMFTRAHGGPYMPLTWLSLAMDHELWGLGEGLDPPESGKYHRTNVLLHALAAVAFCGVALLILRAAAPRSGGRELGWAALFAALLFAVHPLRVESVAWVTERRDVLSGLFFALALGAWLRASPRGRVPSLAPRPALFVVLASGAAPLLFFASVDLSGDALSWRGPGLAGFVVAGALWLASAAAVASAARVEGAPRRHAWLTLAALLVSASFLSKALGVTLPLVLLVLDAWPLARFTRGSALALLIEKAPLFALSAVFGALAVWGQAQFPETLSNWTDHTLTERLIQVLYGLFYYPSRSLVPVGLIPMVQLPHELQLLEPRFLIATVVVLATSTLLFLRRRSYPGPLVAALAFALLVAPVLGLTQAGAQLVADRYSYLPCMPFALLAAGGWLAWRRAAAPGLPVAVAVLVCATSAGLTWRQASHWRDSETLWAHMIEVEPESGLPHMLLGMLRYREGQDGSPDEAAARFEQARVHFSRGFELEELPIPFYMSAYGALLVDMARPDEARVVLERFVASRPEDALGRTNLGVAWMLLDRPGRALSQLQEAVLLDPEYPKAWMHLGFAYEALERDPEALAAFERVLEFWPRYGPAKRKVRALRLRE